MTPRGITRLKTWLVILGVFLLGGVTGAALDSAYRLRGGGWGREAREQRHRGRFEKLKRDLNLTEQQAVQIGAIIEEMRNELRALGEKCDQQEDAARQAARARIRVLLDPEQQQKFDARNAERDARRRRGEDRR